MKNVDDSESLMIVPTVGDVVAGKYEIRRKLGAGGMGVVFEALHLKLQQRLAIKFMLPTSNLFAEALVRFEREARVVARLDSIHVARVIDVDALPSGLPYIVLEYLDGVDLGVELETSGPLPVDVAVDYALQVATALADAHAAGVFHRDIKPANLFACSAGLPGRKLLKVLDFGVAKIVGDREEKVTGIDAGLGTPEYMAPEQLRDASNIDARADVWSLGVVLFELLTGRTPFTGSVLSIVSAVALDPVPSPCRFREGIPPQLERAILRMLEKDPAKRIASMDLVIAHLSPFGRPQRVSSALASAPRTASRLGEILVANSVITAEQLESALEVQSRTGALLGKVLVDLGFLASADLMVALAKQQSGGAPRRRPRANVRPARTVRTGRRISSRARVTMLAGLAIVLLATLAHAFAAPPAAAPTGGTSSVAVSGR